MSRDEYYDYFDDQVDESEPWDYLPECADDQCRSLVMGLVYGSSDNCCVASQFPDRFSCAQAHGCLSSAGIDEKDWRQEAAQVAGHKTGKMCLTDTDLEEQNGWYTEISK